MVVCRITRQTEVEDLRKRIVDVLESEILSSDTDTAVIVMYGGTSGLLHGTFIGLQEQVKHAKYCVSVRFSDHHPQSGDSGSVYLLQSIKYGCFIPIAIHRVFDRDLLVAGGTSLVSCSTVLEHAKRMIDCSSL